VKDEDAGQSSPSPVPPAALSVGDRLDRDVTADGVPPDSFIRMMGHELRTPLQSLSMFVEMMRRQALRGEPAPPESFSKMKSQLDRLSRLVADFLNLSHMAQLPLSLAPLDLEQPVQEVIETRSGALKATAPDTKHSIVFEAENGPFPVMADRVCLEQVFSNLIDNAIKYSPRGGTVEVAMRSRNGWHSVSVSDQGIGIPAEDLPTVGRRFFRARNASSNNFPGLGVGLALAREMVERLRGALRVESQLGQGTRVTVTLPARETEEP
jgi:signal transduction histidine kinase